MCLVCTINGSDLELHEYLNLTPARPECPQHLVTPTCGSVEKSGGFVKDRVTSCGAGEDPAASGERAGRPKKGGTCTADR